MRNGQYEGDFPPIPLKLLEHLEEQFPPFIPSPLLPIEQTMFRAGGAELVRILRTHYEAQNEATKPED